MIDFAVLSFADAHQYRDEYVASLPRRTQWLVAEVTAHGIDDAMLLRGAEGLRPLWAWATVLIDNGPSTLQLRTSQPAGDLQPGVRPPWYDPSTRDPWLSDGALWLIELLGVHLADIVLDAKPGAHWQIYQNLDQPDDYFQHRTVVCGANSRPMDPAGMIHTSVIGHVLRGKPWTEQPSLTSLYEFIVGD